MKVDDVEIAKQQAMRGRPLSKHQRSLLIDAGLDDFVRGGQTQSPMGDLAILGATAAAVKGLPALAANEVSKMTISNAAFKKGLLPQLTKGGIKNWQHLRPWNAFVPRTPLTTGGTLQTAPTKGASAALAIGGVLGDQRPAKGQPPPLPPIPGAIQELQVQPFKSKPTHNDIGVGMTDEERIKATAAQQWDTTDRGFNIKDAAHFLKETPEGGVPDYRSKYPQFKRNSEGKRPAYDEFWRQQIDK